jgi:putative glutamine amidotransferase
MKPVVGITPCSRLADYLESIKRAGGEPLVLSNDDDPADVLARVDAVLLTGGADVDPSLYGQAAHDTTHVDAARDAFEIPLSRAAVARDVPVFAICRGVQVLNVAAGGSLIQDIPSALRTAIDHSVQDRKDAPAHDVRVTPGTVLASTLATPASVDRCGVNSRHHQAIADVAPSFVVSAVSPDGVIEAIERPASRFCVGVQWHPENFWKSGEFEGLFRAFVEAGRERRMTRRRLEETEIREDGD